MTILGTIVALAAALASAYSVVLQAAEARLAPDREGMHVSLLRRLAHRRRWLLGVALQIVTWVLQLIALSFLPIAIVQPMLATSQLALLAIARVNLGERIGRHETLATITLVVGLGAVFWAAPKHTVINVGVGSLAPPMAVVGSAAALAYLLGRAHHRARLLLVLGAGIAYSFSDFVNKLLSDEASAGRIELAAGWMLLTVLVGGMAFLEENTALQHRPTVTVAPVIAAVKVPLPVLMALWAGAAGWGPSSTEVVAMLGGLCLVAGGAAALGRSSAVLRISCGPTEEPSEDSSRAGEDEHATAAQARQGSAKSSSLSE